MKFKLVAICLTLVLCQFTLTAQQIQISKDDVSRYVDSFGDIVKALKQKGDELGENPPTDPAEAQKARETMMKIPVSYGYSSFEDYSVQTAAIAQVYGILKYEMEVSTMDVAYQADGKQVVKQQLESFVQMYGESSVANIRARYEDLDRVAEELSDIDM